MIDLHATISLFNYRCFGDKLPGTLELRPGFSAMVGPNNAGKSTLLRAIRELKPVLVSLRDSNILANLAKGSPHGFNYTDVEDVAEIFCDATTGPVILELTLHETSQFELSRVRLQCKRDNASVWYAEVYSGPEFRHLTPSEVNQFGFSVPAEERTQKALDLSRLYQFVDLISGSMYVPPFRHALAGAAGTSMGDLSNGAEFLTTWANYQGGGNKTQRQLIGKVVENVKSLFSYESLSVQPAVGNTTLQLWVNGKDYRLREMGSGLVQFLLVLGNAAFKKPTLILIDEPELNLHPTLQQEFLTALGSYSSYGVFFATHSLGLGRTASDFLYSVHKQSDASVVKPWGTSAHLGEVLGELSYSAYREAGHECVLAVEGVQDVRPIQQLLRLIRREHSTLVIPLGGDQIVSDAAITAVAELARLARNVFVLLDSERSEANGPPKKGRETFVEECAKIGVRVHLTEKRAFENYFTNRAVKAALGNDYSAIRPYELLSAADRPWGKRDNWRVALEMKLQEWNGTDVMEFLRETIRS
jgi:energy-coupling factor transporter ATP-binding protein EcfA2